MQQARLADGQADPARSTRIAGGEWALVGDVVATRRNDRRLHTTAGDTVRNRETWTVTVVGDDGALTVSHQEGRGALVLPGEYVREHVRSAVAAHRRLPLPGYELARTLLVLGQLQRRRGDRLEARATLQQAAVLLDEVGTARWAITARAELHRIGVQPGPSDRLTPAEARVAELVAAGHTNGEVAAMLVVSNKTVEAHLARIYRKLGIRSRAELGRRMAARDDAGRIVRM